MVCSHIAKFMGTNVRYEIFFAEYTVVADFTSRINIRAIGKRFCECDLASVTFAVNAVGHVRPTQCDRIYISYNRSDTSFGFVAVRGNYTAGNGNYCVIVCTDIKSVGASGSIDCASVDGNDTISAAVADSECIHTQSCCSNCTAVNGYVRISFITITAANSRSVVFAARDNDSAVNSDISAASAGISSDSGV